MAADHEGGFEAFDDFMRRPGRSAGRLVNRDPLDDFVPTDEEASEVEVESSCQEDAGPTLEVAHDELPPPAAAPEGVLVARAARDATRGDEPRARQREPASAPLEVTSVLALTTGPRQMPAVIHPSVMVNGISYMILVEEAQWLRRATSDATQTHYTQKFQRALTALRAILNVKVKAVREVALKKLRLEAKKAIADSDASEMSEVDRQAGDAGSRGKESAQKKSRGRGASRKSKKAERLSQDFVLEIDLGDASPVRALNSLRPLRLESSPDAVRAVVAWCRDHIVNDRVVDRDGEGTPPEDTGADDSQKGKRKFLMPGDSCPNIPGRVHWHTSMRSWCIAYKAEPKAKRPTRQHAGFAVNQNGKVTFDVGILSPEEFEGRRMAKYCDAIAQWNELDKSKKPRIPLPEPEDEPEDLL